MQLTDTEILEKLLKYTNLSQKDFAKVIGGHQPVLSKIKKGEREFSKDILVAIAKCYPEISVTWLLMGEGEMLMPEENDVLNYIPGRPLKEDEMERLVLRLVYRVEELEAWKKEMEKRMKGE